MESFLTDDGKYRIESLSSSTLPGALRVIRDAFCQDEYISIAFGVNKNPQAAEELVDLCAETALDDVSAVAVSVADGEVVSALFNKLQVQTLDGSDKCFFEMFAEERCTQAPSRSYLLFMADVDAKGNFFEKFGIDCSFEFMFLATLREHRKRKLGTSLFKYSIDLARKLRDGLLVSTDVGQTRSRLPLNKRIETYPNICQSIFTTRGSQKIGKLYNFTAHMTVPYSEYEYDGKTFRDRIGDDTAFMQLVALPL